MQGQILRKQKQVNFQPSFRRKPSEQTKPATYRTKSKEILLSLEEKCLVLERRLHEQQSMARKHSNQRRDYSLPVFNNDIITRNIPHFSNKFERNYQNPFGNIEIREARPGLPLKLDLGDHLTSPKKRVSSLRVPMSQEDVQKERKGVKVKFIAGLNQTIIEQDSRHEQQQLNLKQSNQFLPLPLISYSSKMDLGHITKQKKPQQILNKKRVSLSLPSIKNRLERAEQEKISLVCQNSDIKVKQQTGSVDHQISRYEIAGSNQRESEKKILVRKIAKKKRMEIVGLKRMHTEPRMQGIQMQVVSGKKKLSLKYEEQIRDHYQKIEKLYLDNQCDQLQTYENGTIQ